jgi:2-polyprenyl-3-methyl-5-hydroxy-6-metoxy-1,4-benzoquinol methylase
MKRTEIQVKEILNDIIFNVYSNNPVILSSLWDARGEREYIDFSRMQYEAILLDFNDLFSNDTPRRVLEISAFLGVVDIALAKMGFEVHAYDVPEFQNNTGLNQLYAEFNVHPSTGNVKDIWKNGLPYPDNHFDAVLLSEVIEHLNFNPLPVLQEINRILKPEGILYITTPNQVSLVNRFAIIVGRSIRNPLTDSLTQVDQAKQTICGSHWREYTLKELIEVLETTGFSIKKYSFSNNAKNMQVRNRIFLLIFSFIYRFFPGSGNSITVIGKKKEYRPIKFWFYDEYIKYYPNRGTADPVRKNE